MQGAHLQLQQLGLRTRGAEAEIHPWLHSQFEAKPGLQRPWFLFLERKKKKEEGRKKF